MRGSMQKETEMSDEAGFIHCEPCDYLYLGLFDRPENRFFQQPVALWHSPRLNLRRPSSSLIILLHFHLLETPGLEGDG